MAAAVNVAEDEMGLSNDPDLLKERVKALIEEHKHIHPPEIARMLSVPEASLVASAIGAGATRLVPDPAKVLAGITDWGSVLCVFGSECGSFMPLGHVDSIEFSDSTFHLKGGHLDAEIETASIVDAYLFVEQDDMHGKTRTLQFFDGVGDPVLKVYIFHKTKFKEALKEFESLVIENQDRIFTPHDIAAPIFDPQHVSAQADPDTETLVEINSEELLTTFLEKDALFEIECLTRHARAVWTGSLRKIRIDEKMLHMHEEDIRAHLRFDAFKLWSYTDSGGLSAQSEQGRTLRLHKLS